MKKKMLLNILLVFFISTSHYVVGMKKISSFFTRKSSESNLYKTDTKARTRDTRSQGEIRTRGNQERQDRSKDINQALGEALPWYSSSRAVRGRENSRKISNRKDLEISSPSELKKTTDETLARMSPEDAQKIRTAKALQGATWEKKELPEEIKQAIKKKEERDIRITKLQDEPSVPQKTIEQREARVQELGTKIGEERKRQQDMDAPEKAKSKAVVAGYEKEIHSTQKGIRGNREKERVSKLSIKDHESEVQELKQKATAAQERYKLAKKSGNEEETDIAKKDFQKAQIKARVAQTKLDERLETLEAEPSGKTKAPRRVGFVEAIQTSDTQTKKEPLPPDVRPTKGILKKPTEDVDAPKERKSGDTLGKPITQETFTQIIE